MEGDRGGVGKGEQKKGKGSEERREWEKGKEDG